MFSTMLKSSANFEISPELGIIAALSKLLFEFAKSRFERLNPAKRIVNPAT